MSFDLIDDDAMEGLEQLADVAGEGAGEGAAAAAQPNAPKIGRGKGTRKHKLQPVANLTFSYPDEYQNLEGEAKLNESLEKIGMEHFGFNPACNELDFKKKIVKSRKGKAGTRQVCYCHYHNESDCNWRIEIIVVGNKFSIGIGSVPHADHTQSKIKRGIPGKMQEFLTPSKIHLQPDAMVTKVSDAGFKVRASSLAHFPKCTLY